MIKKIIIIWLSILLLVIVGLIVLTSNKDKDNVLTGNISDSTIDNRFYDKIGSRKIGTDLNIFYTKKT